MIKATIIDSTLAQYTAKEFSWLQDLIMTSGYFATQAGVRTFDVAENTVANMGVQIKAGKILAPFSKGGQAWKIICETTGESLVTSANATGSNRVDAVIVKIDQVSNPDVLKTNIATPQYITGTGVSALSDGAIQTIIGADYSFIRLANVTVPNGASSVTNAMIAQLLSKISISPAVDINPDAINVNLGGGLQYLSADAVYSAETDQTQVTQNTTVEVGEANTTTKKNLIAQSFLPTKPKIRGVRLYKSANTGSFTGTVTISLQLDVSGSPSGSDLASVTLSNAVYNALAVGEFQAMFASEYATMDKTKTYWIVATCSTSDTSNHPNLGGNSAGGYANGIVKYKNATDGWLTLAGVDLYFKTLQGINSQLGYISPLPITRQYLNGASPATWAKPAGLKYITVELQGGGGGGQGGFGGSAGSAGGTSSFGAHLSATGGAGGGGSYSDGGSGSNGDVNWSGQQGGHSYDNVGIGGASYFGKSGGRAGNPNAWNSSDNGATGGGGGGYSRKMISASVLGMTETIIGAGGNGGGGGGGYGDTGDAGESGIVIVTEYYI